MIDYELGIKKCAECKEVKGFVDFGVQKSKYPRSYCKSCTSKQSYNRHQEKKLKLYPNLYGQCDECCHIYRHVSFDHCPKCEKQ